MGPQHGVSWPHRAGALGSLPAACAHPPFWLNSGLRPETPRPPSKRRTASACRRPCATSGASASGGSSAGYDWSTAPDQSAAEDARLNRYEVDAARSAQTQAYYDQLVGAFGGGSAPPRDTSNDVLLAAGDGFTMGRGPVSIGQRGRTAYITEQGVEPSIDAMLAKAQADLKGVQRLRDEALTAELNRNSVIRETVTPIFEPITVEVPPVVSEVVGGVGDVVTGGIAGLADMTVAPIADLAQTGLKALHGAVTGDYQPLTPLSSYADSVVNRGAGAWEGIKTTGVNVFNVSPVGMVYHAGTGGYGLTTAAMNGDVRAATREGLGLGLNLAGAAAVGSLGMPRSPSSPSFLVQAETSALQRMAANNRAPTPAADLRRAYQQARGQVDFGHIEADVTFKANGQVKAQGGHFSTSPQLQRIPGTETVSQNGVIYGQVNLLGPDGNLYLKTNNNGFSSMTPDSWSLAQAKGEMSQAFLSRSQLPGGGWRGTSSGVTFRFTPPNNSVPMWRGYPLQNP